ncbi:hypothetical protein ABBQ38_005690 [Trebouxia sp. C0009 RCD-2024]
MSPDLSVAENVRIADAIMDYVEGRAAVRGYNTPEELEMLLEVQRRVREFRHNIRANAEILRSAMLD